MILELRALVSAVAVLLVSLALLFFQWQFVFPAFALLYLAYKYRYYRQRIDPAKTEITDQPTPGRLLEKTTLLFVGLLLVTRLAVFPAFGSVWTLSALGVPAFDLTDLGVFLDQFVSLLAVWGTVLVPFAVVSYTVGQFRVRLLGGVDSEAAAARAALWESMARLPVYLLWAGLFVLGPVYELWVGLLRTVFEPMGVALPATFGLSPVLGNVFPVVVAAGHLIPPLVVAAYVAVSRGKYGDRTVPEVLGYRGLYAPDRSTATVNLVVPAAAYLLYALAVLAFAEAGSMLRAGFVLPPVVAVVLAADVRGVTSQLSRALPSWVPGVGADAVVFGLNAGLATLGLLAVARALLGVGLGADPSAAMHFPVVAAPLGFAANVGTATVKAGRVDGLTDRVAADPTALDEGQVDRLLAYADARSDRLRASAIDGLAAAVWASPYREADAVATFEAAIESEDEQFVRAGLDGLVHLFRADRGAGSVGRLLEADVIRAVVGAMDGEDAETRALAAEAFCRMVATGRRLGRTDDLLAAIDGVPIAAVERAVGGEAANQDLTDAAVECFAVLWYDRDGRVAPYLAPDGERALLVDLVWWSAYASEVPRGKAAFAVASDPAVTDADGLDAVREYLGSDVPLVRFMAAHVVRSSTPRLTDRVDSDALLALLDDEYDLVRWAGADALQEYVHATGESEGVLAALLAHLDESDPATAGAAEATILATLELVDEEAVARQDGVAETVAGYVRSEHGAVAASAARLLATFVAANPESGSEDPVLSALEAGLTHDRPTVREHCVRAAAAVVAESPGAGRPFVGGLVLNLGTSGTTSEMAASALTRVLAEYPEYGTEFLPEMVGGLRNPTSISRQYAGAMVVGQSVSQVTASLLADVTGYDTSGAAVLVGPLVDLAGNADSVTRESVFEALANVSADHPDETREALPAAQAALDDGDVRVRRSAAQVLSNVAIEHPGAVAPLVSNLVIAVDDSDPQMRSIALVTLGTVGAEAPEAVEDDVRRIIGRLDDDSSLVREHAAKAIITIAERQPDIVEPAAEASDRLRRIQRDPAVELDEDLVHRAANAIRTGSPPGEDAAADDGTDVFTPESADEAGKSSDTRVFEAPDVDDDESMPEPPEPGQGEYPTAGPGDGEDGPDADDDGD